MDVYPAYRELQTACRSFSLLWSSSVQCTLQLNTVTVAVILLPSPHQTKQVLHIFNRSTHSGFANVCYIHVRQYLCVCVRVCVKEINEGRSCTETWKWAEKPDCKKMNRGVDQIQGEKPVVENNLLMVTPLYNPVSAPHAPNNLSDEAKTLHGPNASPSAQSNQSVRVCMCVHITYAAETWTVTQKKLRQLRAFYTKYFHNIPGHGHTRWLGHTQS